MINDKNIEADAVKLAGLQIDLLQKIRSRNGQVTIKHLEWFLNLTKGERDHLSNAEIIDINDRFKLLHTFELVIPGDYIHSTQLGEFIKKNSFNWDIKINDDNFKNVSYKLIPGKIYKVEIYITTKKCSSLHFLGFMEKEGMYFVGAQGLSVVLQYKKKELPIMKCIVSYDKERALYNDRFVGIRVPRVSIGLNNKWVVYLDPFLHEEHFFSGEYCLLCFRDIE